MQILLLKAIRNVMRADSDPARQKLFANLKQSSAPTRFVCWFHDRLGKTWASSILVSCYGMKSFLAIAAPHHADRRILAVAVHANARQQVDRIAGWIGQAEMTRLPTSLRNLFRVSSLSRFLSFFLDARSCIRAFRAVHAVNVRNDFLVSCRVASVLACYARAKAILEGVRPSAVVVSSDTNPEEIGFASAARAFRIPTVFVSHAYPSPFAPPLDFTLSILEGEAAVDARRKLGTVRGRVFLAGFEGESAPLDARRFEMQNPVIGIMAPKVVAWPKLAEIVADCHRHFRAKQVLIRWHPSMLMAPQLDRAVAKACDVVETSPAESLHDVAKRCDWVIADENSNVHLPVLKLGVPTVAIRNLGLHLEGRDVYGFQANGIISPSVASIGELRIPEMMSFFSNGWQSRFRRYDASYLRAAGVIAAEAREAIKRSFHES